jgi:hypothetical protein
LAFSNNFLSVLEPVIESDRTKAGRPGFDSQQENHHNHTGSGAHPASYPMGTGTLSSVVKWPGLESDHLPSSADVKNTWNYTSPPTHVYMAWCLIKLKDNVIFYSVSI